MGNLNIGEAPSRYLEALKVGDAAGNANGRIESEKEAVMASDHFCRTHSPEECKTFARFLTDAGFPSTLFVNSAKTACMPILTCKQFSDEHLSRILKRDPGRVSPDQIIEQIEGKSVEALGIEDYERSRQFLSYAKREDISKELKARMVDYLLEEASKTFCPYEPCEISVSDAREALQVFWSQEMPDESRLKILRRLACRLYDTGKGFYYRESRLAEYVADIFKKSSDELKSRVFSLLLCALKNTDLQLGVLAALDDITSRTYLRVEQNEALASAVEKLLGNQKRTIRKSALSILSHLSAGVEVRDHSEVPEALKTMKRLVKEITASVASLALTEKHAEIRDDAVRFLIDGFICDDDQDSSCQKEGLTTVMQKGSDPVRKCVVTKLLEKMRQKSLFDKGKKRQNTAASFLRDAMSNTQVHLDVGTRAKVRQALQRFEMEP